MVRKSQQSVEQPKQPLLLKMSREEAAEKISKRIVEGQEIIAMPVGIDESQYEEAKARYNKWNDYNSLLLKGMFTSEEIADEYNKTQGVYVIASGWYESYQNFMKSLKKKMTKLESTIGRLELINLEQSFSQAELEATLKVKAKPQAIFIGHGRSKLWSRVKSFLHDDYGIDSFTFESESHVGESIVPVLEGFLEKATFAILILTAEDEVAEGKIRARQNVIHEAGLFQGKLGFKKAILLRQEGLDDFSNVDGLQYIGFSADSIEQTFYDLGRVLKREGVI